MGQHLLSEHDLKEIANKIGLKDSQYEAQIVQRSESPLGYLGDHYTLLLRPSAQHFFVKTYPKQFLGEEWRETGIFQREVDVYQDLFSSFSKYLKDGSVSWCPNHVFSKKTVIVLADLSQSGYALLPEHQALNWEHIKTALEPVANLHAASIIYEEKTSRQLTADFPHITQEHMYNHYGDPENATYKWVTSCIKELQAGVELLDGYTVEGKSKIRSGMYDILMEIYPRNAPNIRHRNVFIHGDLWVNNLLFKKSGVDSVIDCKLVDYQFLRLQPPAYDVMNLLYLTTTKTFRDQHEMEMRDHYYYTLKKILGKNNCDIGQIMDYNVWNSSCVEQRRLALIQALMSLHYVLAPTLLDPQSPLQDRMEKCFQHDIYRERVLDIFYEFIEETMQIKRKCVND